MKGSVLKRGLTWSYVVDVGLTPDGKRRQHKRGGFQTRKEAERALRTVLHAVDGGRFVDPTQQTLAGYLRQEWLPAMKPPRLSDATWAGYSWELENRVIPRLGASKLQEVNAAHLNRLYTTLLREGGRAGAPLSPRSVQYVHAILRKALDDAVSWGLLEHNPAARAEAPTQRAVTRARREMGTWTARELGAFLAHVECDRLYAGWVLAATTGMRRGEVLGLRWQDVSLAGRRLAVRQTLVMVSGRPKLSQPKTPRSRRTIDLDGRTLAALRAWKAQQDQERHRWGVASKDPGLVLTREDGGWVAPDGWSAAFDRHVVAAGLPKIRLHDLRHTHATLMLAAGTPPKIVSERLGHTTVAFTLDTYAHAVPGMQAEAADRFAGMVFDR
jgi:integrase